MESLVERLPNVEALVERAQAITLELIQTAIAERGQFTIALAGGSTPKPLYERLATQPLPWDKIHVFWGDERYVPPTHADSNERMARQAWLDHVPIPPENIHRMPTESPNPADSAQAYEQHLRTFFGDTEIPSFDLILLGIGDDGHTASLFPHTAVLNVCDRWIDVGYRGIDPRLTFTIPLLNQARHVLFLVAGASKEAALAAIFAENTNPFDYPARFIRPVGQLQWLIDQAAGHQLNLSIAP